MIPTPADRITEGISSVRQQETPEEWDAAYSELVENYLEGVATERIAPALWSQLAKAIVKLKREAVA